MKARITKKSEVFHVAIPKWIMDDGYFSNNENIVVTITKLVDSKTVRNKEAIIEM